MEIKFQADIELSDKQILDLEDQILELVKTEYGEDYEVEKYHFYIIVVVKVKNKRDLRSQA